MSIPGHGSERVNASLFFGGPQLLGETVGDLVGIQPDYVFVTRFKFFQAMIGDIGGIDVANPTALRRYYLKPEGFAKGALHLGAYDAMAFARIRHNLIRRRLRPLGQPAAGAARHPGQGPRPRRTIPGFIEPRRAHGHAAPAPPTCRPPSSSSSPRRWRRSSPAKITTCVVQGGIGNIGGASVVLPYVDQARRLGDRGPRRRDPGVLYLANSLVEEVA